MAARQRVADTLPQARRGGHALGGCSSVDLRGLRGECLSVALP